MIRLLVLLLGLLLLACSNPVVPNVTPATVPAPPTKPAPPPPIHTNQDVVITYDEGGVVASYADYYHQLYLRKARVVIDGYCGSSCTLALALPNTCVTDKAKLGFHQAYEWGMFGKIVDPTLSDYFMSQYPSAIRQWINEHGGLTLDIKMLEGADLHALVQHC